LLHQFELVLAKSLLGNSPLKLPTTNIGNCSIRN